MVWVYPGFGLYSSGGAYVPYYGCDCCEGGGLDDPSVAASLDPPSAFGPLGPGYPSGYDFGGGGLGGGDSGTGASVSPIEMVDASHGNRSFTDAAWSFSQASPQPAPAPPPAPPPNPGRTPDPSKSNFTWAYLSTAHVTGLVPLPGYHVTIVVQRTDGSYRTYDGGGSTTPPGIKDWSYEPPGNKFAIESPCSTPDEAIDALNQNFKKLTQVPYWPTGPNSNTYAHQLLTLSNFTVPEYLVYPSITPDGDPPDVFTPLDVGPRSTFGWNNNAYGGRNYDSYGQPRN